MNTSMEIALTHSNRLKQIDASFNAIKKLENEKVGLRDKWVHIHKELIEKLNLGLNGNYDPGIIDGPSGFLVIKMKNLEAEIEKISNKQLKELRELEELIIDLF